MKKIYSVKGAKANFSNLYDYVTTTKRPIYIKTKNNKLAVFMAKEEYLKLQESLRLVKIP